MLTLDDLEDWAQDAEAFHHEQGLIQAKEKQRPCAEGLYLVLFEKYREVIPSFSYIYWWPTSLPT